MNKGFSVFKELVRLENWSSEKSTDIVYGLLWILFLYRSSLETVPLMFFTEMLHHHFFSSSLGSFSDRLQQKVDKVLFSMGSSIFPFINWTIDVFYWRDHPLWLFNCSVHHLAHQMFSSSQLAHSLFSSSIGSFIVQFIPIGSFIVQFIHWLIFVQFIPLRINCFINPLANRMFSSSLD